MDETKMVVEALMKVGPRFTDISRATGIPISTVRYILLKRLPKLGLSVRASINYGALGLQRYLVEFESSYPPSYISRLLDLMGETMYLDYYTYLMKMKKFIAIFAVPPYYQNSFENFIGMLKSLGLINDYEIRRLLYMRPLPFMTEFFDFFRGVWKQDWVERRKPRELTEEIESPNLRAEITKVGLMILAELQKNPIPLKLNHIANKLNVSRQTISKHFSRIRKFISSFTIFWCPHMNPELIISPMLVKTKADAHIRQFMLSIPFAHAEFRTDSGEYFIMLTIPSMGLYNTIKLITESIDLIEVDFHNMEYSGKFALQYNLYKDGRWIDAFSASLEKLVEIVKTKNSSGFRKII